MCAPATVIGHGQPDGGIGGAFLGQQEALLVGFPDLRRHDVQDPPTHHPQRLGIMVGRGLEEERLGLLPHLDVCLRGQ